MEKALTGQENDRSKGLWGTSRLWAQASSEQRVCMREVYKIANELIRAPEGTASGFDVRLGNIPSTFFTLRKNFFSTLFYSIYLTLEIPKPRRLLYGKINHLFRIWVTSADNLLDDEDKCVLPLVMPGTSRVMREVVTIMAADRVLWHVLKEAVSDKTVTAQQADALSVESLRYLLPSAAQEASEEGGILTRPEPDYVLETIHALKTGLLFALPFMGIDLIESQMESERVARLKHALMLFGGGCQILDDVRDLGRDFVERRHNYVLSVLAHDDPDVLQMWFGRNIQPSDRLYREALPVCEDAARLGFQKLTEACIVLQQDGVLPCNVSAPRMASSMFTVLDLEDLAHVVTSV